MSKTISELEAIEALSSSDSIPVYDSSNGDARKASLGLLLEWLQDQIDITVGRYLLEKQYETPGATGWVVNVQNTGDDVWLQVDPLAGYAAGTIVMPADPVDQQEVWFRVSETVTTFVVDGNGHNMAWDVTEISLTEFVYKLKFDSVTDSWYYV
jgi:hypothetical protein